MWTFKSDEHSIFNKNLFQQFSLERETILTVFYLINVSDKYIIEPKIDEYEIIFKAEELELTLNEILFREMSDKEYAFKINRESLRKESFFLGIWQCEVVLPFNILEPIIDKIISSKNKNKL